ncbi:MAG TPA: hypothetical protein PK840_07795 [Bacilli bacterium]|nr:hypothetical protein [Bacilli bacterium]
MNLLKGTVFRRNRIEYKVTSVFQRAGQVTEVSFEELKTGKKFTMTGIEFLHKTRDIFDPENFIELTATNHELKTFYETEAKDFKPPVFDDGEAIEGTSEFTLRNNQFERKEAVKVPKQENRSRRNKVR